MSMNDEYGKQPEELNKQPPEIVEYPETISYAEMAEEPEESKEYSEISSKTEASVAKAKEKKKSSKLKRIVKGASAIVAAVVAVTIIAPNIFSSDDTTVNFGEVSATDTVITYNITLENRSDNTLTAVLYNGFTERTKVIEGDSLQWTESSLKPNMKYTLAVKSGSTTIAETEVKTIRTEDVKKTEWYSDLFIPDPDPEDGKFENAYGCTCSTNGNFQFIMQFKDENGWWSDFEATLTDKSGVVSSCTFTEDLHGLQTIPVTDVLAGDTATFTITCISKQYSEDGEKITLLEPTEVEI